MSEEAKYATVIAELRHFPYTTAEELCQAFEANEIEIGIDRGVGRQWAMRDRSSPRWLRIVTTLLTFSPHIILLAFVAWILFTRNWIWLLTSPLVYFAFDILNPGSMLRYRVLRPVLMLSIVAGLLVSPFARWQGLLALSLSLGILWLCVVTLYKLPQMFILTAGIRNEYTVCQLWQGHALHILTKEGDRLTQTWRTQNGEVFRDDDDPSGL